MYSILIPSFEGFFTPYAEFLKDGYWIGKNLRTLIQRTQNFRETQAFTIDKRVHIKDREILSVPQLLFGIYYLISKQKKGEEGFLCLVGTTCIGPIRSPENESELLYVHLSFFKEDESWKCSLRNAANIIII